MIFRQGGEGGGEGALKRTLERTGLEKVPVGGTSLGEREREVFHESVLFLTVSGE